MNPFNKTYFTTINFRLKVTEKIIMPPVFQKGYLLRQSLGNALHKTLGDYALEKFWTNKLTSEQHKTLKISSEPPDTYKMIFNVNDFNSLLLLGEYLHVGAE